MEASTKPSDRPAKRVRADAPSLEDARATASAHIFARAAVPRDIFAPTRSSTHFATLYASNAASISSLALVKLSAEPSSYLSNCLVETKEGIGYQFDLS